MISIVPLIWAKFRYLKKAQALLDMSDYVGQGYSSQFAKAVIIVGQESDTFEIYARRLTDMELDPDVALHVAQVLVNRATSEYRLASWFLEEAVRLDPSKRVTTISMYARLSKLAQGRGDTQVSRQLLRKAAHHSGTLHEFFEQGIEGDFSEKLLVFNTVDGTHLILKTGPALPLSMNQ